MTPSAELIAGLLGWRGLTSSPGWRAPISSPSWRAPTSLWDRRLPASLQAWRQRLLTNAEYVYFCLIKAYFDLLCLVAEGIYTVLGVK